ncbi:MAG: 3-hydroxyacyl-CoA dehydrogenase NAD-binding domain-containing protein, partial [Desulfitobacteriaceae bacterium]
MEIKKIVVVGSGQMGIGIAQVCLMSGFSVTAIDVQAAALERVVKQIGSSLGRSVEKGKLSETDRDNMLTRLNTSSDFATAADADFVIEAVNEDIDLKMQVFAQLDKIVKSEAIFASNTSALSITTMATATARRDRFVGMHFFLPVQVM